MLLKSCAMPPASVPMASIFCDWRSWISSRSFSASASFRAVMSRKFTTTACTLGSWSRLLNVLSIQRHDPSLCRTMTSCVTTFPGSRITSAHATFRC